MKLNFGIMLSLKEAGGLNTAYIPLILLNAAIPLAFARVLHRRRYALEEESNINSIGALYDGKRGFGQIWLLPIAFCIRRTVFIALTVFVLDKPNI